MDHRGDARIPIAVLVLPILPDTEESWRRFTQDLLEGRTASANTRLLKGTWASAA